MRQIGISAELHTQAVAAAFPRGQLSRASHFPIFPPDTLSPPGSTPSCLPKPHFCHKLCYNKEHTKFIMGHAYLRGKNFAGEWRTKEAIKKHQQARAAKNPLETEAAEIQDRVKKEVLLIIRLRRAPQEQCNGAELHICHCDTTGPRHSRCHPLGNFELGFWALAESGEAKAAQTTMCKNKQSEPQSCGWQTTTSARQEFIWRTIGDGKLWKREESNYLRVLWFWQTVAIAVEERPFPKTGRIATYKSKQETFSSTCKAWRPGLTS